MQILIHTKSCTVTDESDKSWKRLRCTI